MNSTSGSKRRKKDLKVKAKGGLALGYEVLEIRDEGDEGMTSLLLYGEMERKGLMR
jgi:hypothetical protein